MNPDQAAENKGQKSETLKTGKQCRPSKSWFCEEINKVDKSLVRMTERKDGRQITRIKNGTETPLPTLQIDAKRIRDAVDSLRIQAFLGTWPMMSCSVCIPLVRLPVSVVGGWSSHPPGFHLPPGILHS